MDFDEQLTRFFGTADIDTLAPERLLDGVKLLQLQFGLERDADRRFELWCLMYMLGVAPDADETFDDEADRDAAREFMDIADREIDEP
jgi:hypothetical protein